MTTTASPSTPEPHYGALYGGLAFVAGALTGGQLYADIVEEDRTITFLNLWEMLGMRYGASLAILSLTMVGLLVLLCVIAAVRPRTPIGIPIAVAVLGVLGAVMLINRVGAGYETGLSDAGSMLLVTCWSAVGLGVVNTIHLAVARRDHR